MKRNLLVLIMCLSIILFGGLALAQDATPIPILPAATADGAAPGLPGGAPTLPDALPAQGNPAAPSVDNASSATDLGDTCPTLVQEGFSATEIVCEALGPGQVCIGNGTVQSQLNDAAIGFELVGDIAPITSLAEFSLQSVGTPNNVWSIVTGLIRLDSANSGAVNTSAIFFGDVTVTDAGETDVVITDATRTAEVIAQRGLNVRRTPENAGVVVWQLGAGDEVTVTGISPDEVWLRIVIPNRFAGTGWVYAPFMNVPGGAETLPSVTSNSPVPNLDSAPDTVQTFGPMQAITLRTAAPTEGCGPTIPPSGLLLQSPSGLPDDVLMQINGTELAFNGTVFIQAITDSALIYNVLEGALSVTLNDAATAANAGQRVRIPIGGAALVEDISLPAFTALPTQLLPRQFELGAFNDSAVAPANDSDTTTGAGGFASPTPQGATEPESDEPAQPTPAPPAEDCTLTGSNINPNIRSGPGTVYPVVGTLPAGSSAIATGRNADEFNILWYQTDRGWLRFDTVNTEGDCGSVPLVDAPPLPATPTPEVSPTAESTTSLVSSVLGNVCEQGQVSATSTSDGTELALQLGGVFTVTAGTTITVSTQGGQLRPEFGDFIQIQLEDGTRVFGSGEGRTLTLAFDDSGTFILRFSAANGDVVTMDVACEA